MIWALVCVKNTLQPASHILSMDINELFVSPTSIWLSHSVLVSCGNVNEHSLFYIIITPFVSLTLIGVCVGVVCS